MSNQNSWLLPEGMEEIFPDESESLDRLGRQLLDHFATWGYRLVMPPIVDFLDSLRIGTGSELDSQTLKLSDPVSGRLLGLRADITPQVARIDARSATRGMPSRLCYVGSVVHALSGHLEKSRNPIQVGAELYGHAGRDATDEVIRLMLESLALAGLRDVHLDLGHVGVYRALSRLAGLDVFQEAELFDILQRKDATDLQAFLINNAVNGALARHIGTLLELGGDPGVIAEAKARLGGIDAEIDQALDEVSGIADCLRHYYPNLPLNIDLAELRGYRYHTGVVFAAFVPGQGREIARGGRYDDIGKVFGHARPAVGFSADLKILATLSTHPTRGQTGERIFAPAIEDDELDRLVMKLRREGKVVIKSLGSMVESPHSMGCSRQLVVSDRGTWSVT